MQGQEGDEEEEDSDNDHVEEDVDGDNLLGQDGDEEEGEAQVTVTRRMMMTSSCGAPQTSSGVERHASIAVKCSTMRCARWI